MGVLLVPSNLTRREAVWAIRRYFEERFRLDERIEQLSIVNGSCYLKLAIAQPEVSPLGRLQYHSDEYHLKYEIVRGAGQQVMEG